MNDENEFEEVSIISNTELPIEKLTPLQISDTREALYNLNPDRDSIRWSSLEESEKSQSSEEAEGSSEGEEEELSAQYYETVVNFDKVEDSSEILSIITLEQGLSVPEVANAELTQTQLRGLAEYRSWTQQESVLTELHGDKPLQLNRIASATAAFIAVGETSILLTNGHESKLLKDQYCYAYAKNFVVLWGKHFFVPGKDEVSIYNLNYECIYSVQGTTDEIVSSTKKLAFYNDYYGSVCVFVRTFDIRTDPNNCKPGEELKYQDEQLWSDVTPEKSKFWSKGNPWKKDKFQRLVGAGQTQLIRICPFTDEIIFLNWDEPKHCHYIQRGKDVAVLHPYYDNGLQYSHVVASYSSKWYIIGYPDPEPQEKKIFLIDQKTLTVTGLYFTDFGKYQPSNQEATVHFLKPQKYVFPFMILTQTAYLLLCEFRDKLYPVSVLKCEEGDPEPIDFFTTHLSGGIWLCLETFTKGCLLVINTDKLYKLLRID